MRSFNIKDKFHLHGVIICLPIFLIINLLLINLCLADDLYAKNEPEVKKRQELLDKEEAMFWSLMFCLNKDGGDSEREFIKLNAPENRNNRYYSKPEPAPIKMRSKHEEQSKIKQKRAYYQLGYQYAQDGDDVSAITQFEMVLKYDPHDKDSNYNLGYLYAKTGRYEKAVEAYNRALELSSDPDDCQIYYNLALIYDRNLKDREKSSRYYKRFLGK